MAITAIHDDHDDHDEPIRLNPVPAGDEVAAYQAAVDHMQSLSTEIRLVTPETAREMLQTLDYERQRSLSPRHLLYLQDVMRKGQLIDMVVQLCVLPDGRIILIDGYHRLSALIQVGLPLVAVMLMRQVANERAVADEYAKIDRSRMRQPVDMLKAYELVSDDGALGVRALGRLQAGADLVATGWSRDPGRSDTKSLITRSGHTEEWLAECAMYAECIMGADNLNRNLLHRAAVVSVALATLRHQPALAKTFWSQMAQDSGLEKGQPARALLGWLRAYPASKYIPPLYARYVAVAWNAFYQGRSLNALRVVDKTAPIRILGTPIGREPK